MISTEGNTTHFGPGEKVRGTAAWEMEKPPGKMRVSIGWRTAGTGMVDEDCIAELEWQETALTGTKDFEFQLPDGPFSYVGDLLSIEWAVTGSCRAVPEERFAITVGPGGNAVVDQARGFPVVMNGAAK